METKGLQTNMKKTKIMVNDGDTGSVRSSGRWPCRQGVDNNSYLLCFLQTFGE